LKFLNISDTKLKVTLTSADCLEYAIDAEEGYNTRRMRSAVRRILTLAEEECGFSAVGEKILVQLYPLPSGECELFVTVLTTLSGRDRDAVSSADGVSLLEQARAIYRFADFAGLADAVRAVYREGVESDLYSDDLGRFYLSLKEEITDGISEFEIFIEYGDRLAALPIAVLSEYGKCLAKGNALEYVISHSSDAE
jgi:negative regulator of genetic competence, sporulation and motility